MKKFMTLLVLALATALIVPSCTSDETFEDVVESSELDESFTTDSQDRPEEKPGD